MDHRLPGASIRSPTSAPELVDQLLACVADYAIFVLDVDGNVASWNVGAERLLGYKTMEILGLPLSVLYPTPEREAGKADQDLAIAMADGRLADEWWRVRQDGTTFWADVVITALRGDDGRLAGFGVIMRDLSERHRGEEALRQSEERFRLLVDRVADYAIFLLDPDGCVASWNLGAERLKGYRADEIIGRALTTFYTEEDRRAGVPDTALREAEANGSWAAEGWRVRKDGSHFWASVLITRLTGSDGSHRGFAKVTRDLTERKRNEDALRGVLARERDASNQLRELDRMRNDLVSTVAHDLRAPVGVIQAHLDLLRADWATSDDAAKQASLETIDERLRTLASLVDDVFDLMRIDVGHIEVAAQPFDLVRAVEHAITDGRSLAVSVPVELEAEPDTWAVGDRRRTWQIVVNLVSNAVKFTGPGSTVRVVVARSGDEVVVSVVDDGPGIDVSEQDVIFDRFTRLSGSAGTPGSGLGLFIARSLAEAQGGRLQVESAPGSGSTFSVWLPAAEAGG